MPLFIFGNLCLDRACIGKAENLGSSTGEIDIACRTQLRSSFLPVPILKLGVKLYGNIDQRLCFSLLLLENPNQTSHHFEMCNGDLILMLLSF